MVDDKIVDEFVVFVTDMAQLDTVLAELSCE
jgi:hypothetical protein